MRIPAQTLVQVNSLPLAKAPLKRELAIAARWEELLPWCLMDARKTSDPANTLFMFKQRHHARCIELFCNRIPWATVRRHSLDDPRHCEAYFKSELTESVERRRSRMGRTKGKRKDANITRSHTQH